MVVTRDQIVRWLEKTAAVLSENKEYLTQLDSPIGGKRTGAKTTLPGELLRMIPGRLRMLALIWSLFFGLTLLFQFIIGFIPGFDRWPIRVNGTFAAIFFVSLGVVAAVAQFRQRPLVDLL